MSAPESPTASPPPSRSCSAPPPSARPTLTLTPTPTETLTRTLTRTLTLTLTPDPNPDPNPSPSPNPNQANGLARHAVDDQHNLHTAALRWRHGARADALAGLGAALKTATALGYDAARARASAALGQALLRGPDGQWSPAELGEAHAHLARALPLAEAVGSAALEAEVYGSLSLYHLLSAEATAAADMDMGRLEQTAAALFTARRARELGCAARGGGESALELTNLAVAVLSSRPPTEWGPDGAAEEAAEASTLLEP